MAATSGPLGGVPAFVPQTPVESPKAGGSSSKKLPKKSDDKKKKDRSYMTLYEGRDMQLVYI